ncbi:Dps family protein [Fulvivirga sediminis]|uniref:DNA starvation/stationary phase protection protein n=1 Tax=Fulvivirga sediminis TaxID=2803949 RepID=A0A937FC15_9BACT|nr:DNA starvation/stationary phase protection protein [Fulvivirga sediminis]MBL3658912.1 DNA starvation/stationary phase protection protein [Fulvivirga sediminis]
MKNKEIIDKLNALLANYQIYYQNLRGFHWNIQGKHFFQLHAKFEELYLDSAQKIDTIAERILTIEGKPLHAFDDYIATATIKAKKDVHDGEGAVSGIIEDLNNIVSYEREIKELAAEAGDDATEDLMTGFIDEQEKTLWMMKAWLK